MIKNGKKYKAVKAWYFEIIAYLIMYLISISFTYFCINCNAFGLAWVVSSVLALFAVLLLWLAVTDSDKYYTIDFVPIEKFKRHSFINLEILEYNGQAFEFNNHEKKLIKNTIGISLITRLSPNKAVASRRIYRILS